MKHFHYSCTECNQKYDILPKTMLCPDCQKNQDPKQPLKGILEVSHPQKATLDNIFSFLPIARHYFPQIPVGNNPLWPCYNLRKKVNLEHLFVKNDASNPTGSFKDRASFLVAAQAKAFNISEIVVASTGNAASSMAGIGAACGLKVTIFLPKNVPEGKLVQSLQYGAQVIMVDGNYDLAYDLSLEYSKKSSCINRNTAYNPMTIEGKKTAAIEIVRDLQKAPDNIFLPVGDGVILSGLYKGFQDLLHLGLINRMPTIYAIMAEHSNAIFRAFHNKGIFDFQSSHTIADSICVDIPRAGILAIKNLWQYKGECLTVSDEEILLAQKELSQTEGLFCEPAGACAYAGFLKYQEKLSPQAITIILTTGTGLKDLSSAQKKIKIPKNYIKTLSDIS